MITKPPGDRAIGPRDIHSRFSVNMVSPGAHSGDTSGDLCAIKECSEKKHPASVIKPLLLQLYFIQSVVLPL